MRSLGRIAGKLARPTAKVFLAAILCTVLLSPAACSGEQGLPAGESPAPAETTAVTQRQTEQATPAPLATALPTATPALRMPATPAGGATAASTEASTAPPSPPLRPTLLPTPTPTATPVLTPTPTPAGPVTDSPTPTLPPTLTPPLPPTRPSSPAEERAALIAFYNATGGPDWENNANWLSSAPLGQWYGITTGSDGRVISVKFDGNGLNGRLPSELGNLSSLEILWVRSCQCSGEIPPEIGHLSNLQKLILEGNRFSGAIPPSLGNLSRLREFSLTGNTVTGPIPQELGRLTHLEILWLDRNQLTGEIPDTLRNLANLKMVSLSRNRLNGTVPTWLGDLAQLEKLWIGGNPQLAGCTPGGLRTVSNLWVGDPPLPFCDVAPGSTPTPVTPTPVIAMSTPVIPTPAIATSTPTPAPPTPEPPSLDFPWAQDGLTWWEESILGMIKWFATQHPNIGEQVLTFPWLADDATVDEHLVIQRLRDLIRQNPQLAETVVQQPWLAKQGDSITRLMVAHIEAEKDLETANTLMNLPWRDSPLFGYLFAISKGSEATFKQLINLPWIQDGPDETEWSAVPTLWAFFELNQPDRARALMKLPWFQDGITRDEGAAIGYLSHIAGDDPDLVRQVMDFPWFADGITGTDHFPDFLHGGERLAVSNIKDLAAKDLSLARQVAGFDWVSDDDMTLNEAGVLNMLTALDSPTANTAASLTYISELPLADLEFPDLHGNAAITLLETARIHRSRFDQIINQAWFTDGVSDQDAALIVVQNYTDSRSSNSPDLLFRDLMQNSEVHSFTASVPLAGNVKVFVVHPQGSAPSQDFTRVVRSGISQQEGFMGVAWPKIPVVILDSPAIRRSVNFDTHIKVKRETGTDGQSISDRTTETLHHEMAHFYWDRFVAPHWLREGSANFLASYTLSKTAGLDLEERYKTAQRRAEAECGAPANVNGWYESGAPKNNCAYFVGESFLLGIYNALGEPVVSSSMRELYLLARSNVRPVTEDQIYQAFLSNTPTDRQDEFRELYRRLHGRPVPEP